MQLIPRYLVNNIVTIVANDKGFTTELRQVYSRQIKIYKGIDNVLQFRLLNADQKPINVATYTPKFVAFDESGQLLTDSQIRSKRLYSAKHLAVNLATSKRRRAAS